jgi:hypothetical protein
VQHRFFLILNGPHSPVWCHKLFLCLENRPDDLDDFSVPQVDFDVMIDGESFAEGESQATGSSGNSCTSQAPPQAEGVTTIEPMVTAGTSRS